jgi:hypothetical protein
LENEMDRALIFCTAHLQSDPSRYQLWAKYYAEAFKNYNVDLLMVNDGPCNPDDKPPEAEVIVLEPHLGRPGHLRVPGWKRSFAYALRKAMDRGYRWIGHVESDLYIKPQAIPEFLEHLHRDNGFGSGWCRTYRFPESSLLILNDKHVNETLINRYKAAESWQEEIDFERMLWALGPGRILEGDRYEGQPDRLRRDDTYIGAIHFAELNSVAHVVEGTPFAVVLLTTWNRPKLLSQSLPLILAECRRNRWPLVISDDHSMDGATLKMLDAAVAFGAVLIRRSYQRLGSDNPHHMTQLNNLFAFRSVTEKWPNVECILKVDDDITMIPDAFHVMQQGWELATREYGTQLLELSGLHTCAEPILEQRAGYAITHGACNAAVLYRTADWIIALNGIDETEVIRQGFDLYMLNEFGRGRLFASLTPSVFYHCGHRGVHGNGTDTNLDYCGSLLGITAF